MPVPYEQTVNTYLADVLAESLSNEFVVIPEQSNRANNKLRRFDIKIEYKDFEFVIEASFDETDAEIDAKHRIEEGLINTIAIALHYDSSAYEQAQTSNQITDSIKNTPLKMKVYSLGSDISNQLLNNLRLPHRAIAQGNWILISVDDFAAFTESIIELVVNTNILENLTSQIENQTESFVKELHNALEHMTNKETYIENLTQTLFPNSDVPEEVCLSHTFISLLMASILYESVFDTHASPERSLVSLQTFLAKNTGHPLLAMKEAFSEILSVDYQNVFNIVVNIVNVLLNFENRPIVMNEVRKIINLTSRIILNKAILRQDFIGHIYHKITGDIATRKGYATYYTKSSIALFLTTLTLDLPNNSWRFDWSNFEAIKDFKICDFACGSGTLLSAMYMTILARYRNDALQNGTFNLELFHKSIIENAIWGFDALSHALQTASIVLSLHEPKVSSDRNNLYHMPVSHASLGSLNLWLTYLVLIPLVRTGADTHEKIPVSVPKFDIIIMNPPFARSTAPGKNNVRPRIFDFIVNENTYKELWKQYSSLNNEIGKKFINDPLYKMFVGERGVFRTQDINPLNSGATLPFIFLADKYLKPNGRLSLVLPKPLLINSAYFLARLLIITNYKIEFVIISAEKDNFNFSYSTNLSETLLILTKKDDRSTDADSNTNISILKLEKQPKNNLEGLILGKTILKERNMSDIHILNSQAHISKVSLSLLKKFLFNWAFLTDFPEELTSFLTTLVLHNNLLGKEVDLINMRENSPTLFDIAIRDSRIFRGGNLVEHFDFINEGTLRVLKQASREVMKTLKLNGQYLESIRPRDVTAIELFNTYSGSIIIPSTIRWDSLPLFASYTPQPIISTVAFICKIHTYPDDTNVSETMNKALVAWINSSYFLMYLRAMFSSIEGNYGHIKSWHLRSLIIPDLEDNNIRTRLKDVFERYKTITFSPLPNQYQQSIDNSQGIRLEYDLDIITAICNTEIDREELKRQLLALYIKIQKTIAK